ncbi:MAG: alpha/beta hydrolase [Sulfurovum sp.]|nr:alpha/beta hydrolase [Sulfurovum sp.]
MLLSDNDPWVKVDEAKTIALQINASFTLLNNAGHINADSGYGKWNFIENLVMKQ